MSVLTIFPVEDDSAKCFSKMLSKVVAILSQTIFKPIVARKQHHSAFDWTNHQLMQFTEDIRIYTYVRKFSVSPPSYNFLVSSKFKLMFK